MGGCFLTFGLVTSHMTLILHSITLNIGQASAVFKVGGLAPGAETSYVWLGNQWNSGLALTPPGPRNHDLLYW